MCGISVVVEIDGRAADAQAAIARMHAAQKHRGPDGEAFLWYAGGVATRYDKWPPLPDASHSGPAVGIGFHQLRIHDFTPASLQPIASPDGRVWMAFNGEIYNASDLRAMLTSRGHRFRTVADSEVLLAAYDEWGPQAFSRCHGMWAVAILDCRRNVVVASRDRLGIKPLYYAIDRGRILMASEPHAVVRARGSRPAANRARVREFLAGMPPQQATGTFFDGVELMPAASTWEIALDAGRAATTPPFASYWLGRIVAADRRDTSFDASVDALREALDRSIAEHTAAAVPVGCLLSGGLDASFIACTMASQARAAGDPQVSAYSITFADQSMNEAPFIWTVARAAHLKSHTFELSAATAWDATDRVIGTQGQPLLGQDLIAQYHAYKLAAEHGAIVVLEGQGSDELLGGLPSYASVRLDDLRRGGQYAELAQEAWATARTSVLPLPRAIARVGRRALNLHHANLAGQEWLEPDDDNAEAVECGDALPPHTSALTRHLFTLVTRTNLPTVLQAQDRNAMAHGIESRVPFLDHRVVELCFSMPDHHKVFRGVRKRALVAAARGRVPDAVLGRRDKRTFISKIDWMPLRTHSARQLREMAGSAAFNRQAWFKAGAVRRFVERYLAGEHDDVLAVWRLYTCWRWMHIFDVAE